MSMSMRSQTGKSPRLKSDKRTFNSQTRVKQARLRQKNRQVRESKDATKHHVKQMRSPLSQL